MITQFQKPFAVNACIFTQTQENNVKAIHVVFGDIFCLYSDQCPTN